MVNRKHVSRQLMTAFLRMVNKYNAMEKFPVGYGTEVSFYHSERHLLDALRDDSDLNITDLARRAGVTKGAVSQAVARLERKGAVERHKDSGDDKQVLVRLTPLGQTITAHHQKVNEQTVDQLCDFIKRRPQEHVDFLCETFAWIEAHLEAGLRQMQARHR